MEILKDIGSFIWAVLSIWQAYMTGGIVIALLGIYERVMRKTVSLRTFIIGVVAFLLVAFFMAWRDQYHAKLEANSRLDQALKDLAKERDKSHPKFDVRVLRVTTGVLTDGGKQSTICFALVIVVNSGSPSAAVTWHVEVELPDGKTVESDIYEIAKDLELKDDKGNIADEIYAADALYAKMTQPVPTGARVPGWLQFRFEIGLRPILEDSRTTWKISFTDVEGTRWTGTYHRGNQSEHLYIPGMVHPKQQPPSSR